MYEEPYRWVEAVGNRRTYLDEQFKQGSPVVGLAYDGGLVLVTLGKGTPKLYEIYDRIALGGMGHPADLEKLRFSLLDMAHMEGFNRSPSDVTGGRLVKYGVAPVIKQAFEEVFKAPFILKLLLAELGHKPSKDVLLTVNYDGTFEESPGCAVLAATPAIQEDMAAYLRRHLPASPTLADAVGLALKTWAFGDAAQRRSADEAGETKADSYDPADGVLWTHVRESLQDKTIECAVLDRHQAGSSKYRALRGTELERLLPPELNAALPH